jgi:hypothetical protein
MCAATQHVHVNHYVMSCWVIIRITRLTRIDYYYELLGDLIPVVLVHCNTAHSLRGGLQEHLPRYCVTCFVLMPYV